MHSCVRLNIPQNPSKPLKVLQPTKIPQNPLEFLSIHLHHRHHCLKSLQTPLNPLNCLFVVVSCLLELNQKVIELPLQLEGFLKTPKNSLKTFKNSFQPQNFFKSFSILKSLIIILYPFKSV